MVGGTGPQAWMSPAISDGATSMISPSSAGTRQPERRQGGVDPAVVSTGGGVGRRLAARGHRGGEGGDHDGGRHLHGRSLTDSNSASISASFVSKHSAEQATLTRWTRDRVTVSRTSGSIG